MFLMKKVCKKARKSILFDDPKIPDEETLCLLNPEYSCVTCANIECPDFGTRFASCPEHKGN